MALEAGTRLGPYEVTAQIGAGGMGAVVNPVCWGSVSPILLKLTILPRGSIFPL